MSDAGSPQPESGEVPAQPGSPLANLRARREEIASKQFDDVEVPRWNNPALVIRYKPIEHSTIRAAQTRVEKAAKKDKAKVELGENLGMLARGFVGLIGVMNGTPHALVDVDTWVEMEEDHEEGDYFDGFAPLGPEVAQTLGAAVETASGCLRHLFLADGDIMSHALRLGEFSGYQQANQVDEELRGE